MRQLTFPSDTTWQKSMCLTASLNSSTITSTMREVSEGRCWPGKLLFYHAARWLFWMKEGSQALCPYSEMLNGITFSPAYPGTWMAGKWPSQASFQHYIFILVVLLRRTMTNIDVLMTYYREPFHSWEPMGVCHHSQTKLPVWITLQGLLAPEVIYPWALIWHKVRDRARIQSQTWESPKTPIPTVQEYQVKPWASKIPYK